MVAGFQRRDAFADFNNNARTFMTQNGGENPFGIISRACEFVGMANTCRFNLDKNLARFGAFKVHFHDLEGFACFKGNGGFGAHHFWGLPMLFFQTVGELALFFNRAYDRLLYLCDNQGQNESKMESYS
ncbi:hypothetical protein PH7735_02672 [Shimia thalassica]|uniref:Uncharacterized protein n=1 Tax=Shimia thalassica TaxID=1715693 RepID=A0A0P1IKC2_9RHOB|nr:hypothetical protein PH7735_02672 [Shimia thalassica]